MRNVALFESIFSSSFTSSSISNSISISIYLSLSSSFVHFFFVTVSRKLCVHKWERNAYPHEEQDCRNWNLVEMECGRSECASKAVFQLNVPLFIEKYKNRPTDGR